MPSPSIRRFASSFSRSKNLSSLPVTCAVFTISPVATRITRVSMRILGCSAVSAPVMTYSALTMRPMRMAVVES